MSTANELLNSLSQTGDAEEHIVIGEDRFISVPPSLRKIAVQYDHNVMTAVFDCPRYWDGGNVDLTTLKIFINYMRADGNVGLYHAADVTVDESDENIIHFSWKIKRNVTEAKGGLSFLVCAKETDDAGDLDAHWNSELNNEMTVSEGREVGNIIAEKYPDVITQILTTLDNLPAGGDTPEGGGSGEPGAPGEDGGYYSLSLDQTEAGTLTVSYSASKEDMPAIEPKTFTLPVGPQGEPGTPGEKGDKGDKGDPGTTPVKGVDYYTPEEKAEIIQAILAELNAGIIGYIDGNTITIKGALAEGTYAAYYEVDGELVEIGELTLAESGETPDPVTYTIKWCNYDGTVLETDTATEGETPVYNGATPARAADGQYTYAFKGWADEKGNVGVVAATANAIYTAVYDQTAKPVEPDPDPIKPKNFATPSAWVQKGRIRSNGEVATDAIETTYATDFVDCEKGDVIYISNAWTNHNLLHGAYSSSKGVLGTAAYNGSNDYFVFSDTTDTSATVTIKSSSVAYMRFTLGNITDTKKVVINIKRNGEWRTK